MKFDVEQIYCISLEDRIDRQEASKENLKILSHHVTHWLVPKDSENPERGCYNSHREIAKFALEKNYSNIMVFEDDVVFHRIARDNEMKVINKFISLNVGDLLYLGGLLGEMQWTGNRGIVRCELYCTQSYIIHRAGMEKLASAPYSGLPIDVYFKLNLQSFSVFPMLTSQIPEDVCRSDISGKSDRLGVITSAMWRKNRRSQYISVTKNALKFFISAKNK